MSFRRWWAICLYTFFSVFCTDWLTGSCPTTFWPYWRIREHLHWSSQPGSRTVALISYMLKLLSDIHVVCMHSQRGLVCNRGYTLKSNFNGRIWWQTFSISEFCFSRRGEEYTLERERGRVIKKDISNHSALVNIVKHSFLVIWNFVTRSYMCLHYFVEQPLVVPIQFCQFPHEAKGRHPHALPPFEFMALPPVK